MATKINAVGMREFRENTEKYIAQLKKGKSFTVLRRSRPVFNVVPADVWGDEGNWETVVDFTKINKSGVPAQDVLKALKKLA
jgi:antitoxin (DNA-binding transcriptional repressor) of toxin-antitoxin stability system